MISKLCDHGTVRITVEFLAANWAMFAQTFISSGSIKLKPTFLETIHRLPWVKLTISSGHTLYRVSEIYVKKKITVTSQVLSFIKIEKFCSQRYCWKCYTGFITGSSIIQRIKRILSRYIKMMRVGSQLVFSF